MKRKSKDTARTGSRRTTRFKAIQDWTGARTTEHRPGRHKKTTKLLSVDTVKFHHSEITVQAIKLEVADQHLSKSVTFGQNESTAPQADPTQLSEYKTLIFNPLR